MYSCRPRLHLVLDAQGAEPAERGSCYSWAGRVQGKKRQQLCSIEMQTACQIFQLHYTRKYFLISKKKKGRSAVIRNREASLSINWHFPRKTDCHLRYYYYFFKCSFGSKQNSKEFNTAISQKLISCLQYILMLSFKHWNRNKQASEYVTHSLQRWRMINYFLSSFTLCSFALPCTLVTHILPSNIWEKIYLNRAIHAYMWPI